MTIDVAAERIARQEALNVWRLREFEQQLQIEVSGTATTVITQLVLDLDFDVAFTLATGQRNSLLEKPHVWFGFEQTKVATVNGKPTDVAVMIGAAVTKWKQRRLDLVGATVAISALAPAAVTFSGVLHATFQGLGTTQDEPDLEG
jgi:hypothetical protein